MEGKGKKDNHEDKEDAEKIRKQLEKLNVCPYCRRAVEFIWVHGHYQCPVCKNVVISCCGDD